MRYCRFGIDVLPNPASRACSPNAFTRRAAIIDQETAKTPGERAATFAAKATELRARAKETRNVTARLGFLTAAQSYEMLSQGAETDAERALRTKSWHDIRGPR